MKKEYISPDAEIDKFNVPDVVLTNSSNPEIPDTEVDF